MNELIKELGFENLYVIDSPFFYWNGETITNGNDENQELHNVSAIKLAEGDTIKDFIGKHDDKKIVLMLPLFQTHNISLNIKERIIRCKIL